MTQSYSKEDPKTIESLFSKIAPQYDRANSLMSLNLHKRWNRKLVQTTLSEKAPQSYLDLCSGTGEIAFTALKKIPEPCEAFLLDFSDQMLEHAKKKASKMDMDHHRLNYLHADAQNIPLPSDSIDAVTMAYGIRNVHNTSACLKDVHRVLKKGGTFAILELTQPTNSVMKMGHQVYTKCFLPLIGKLVASDKQAYQYLCQSIQDFLKPEDLSRLMELKGFQEVTIKPLNGGIATLIVGKKRC